jgi:hypothetical protein
MRHACTALPRAARFGSMTVNPREIRRNRAAFNCAADGTSILFEADAAISYNVKFI